MPDTSNLPPGVTERMIPGNEPDAPTEDVDAAYLALCEAAERFDDNPYAVEALSLAAVVLSGHTKGCDGCARELDPEPFAYAGMSWAVQLDGGGDPDVSICPVCSAEARDFHYSEDGCPIYQAGRPPLESLAGPSTEGANDDTADEWRCTVCGSDWGASFHTCWHCGQPAAPSTEGANDAD